MIWRMATIRKGTKNKYKDRKVTRNEKVKKKTHTRTQTLGKRMKMQYIQITLKMQQKEI